MDIHQETSNQTLSPFHWLWLCISIAPQSFLPLGILSNLPNLFFLRMASQLLTTGNTYYFFRTVYGCDVVPRFIADRVTSLSSN